ncbi:hypothetical protein [Pluralibacter sp.]|uniref:hypothetical protein n=1 Tax=Pluralibacter sp. TaxID=1920032 RepID=UPI0025CBBC9E|nr:hypothetical protein [Pluralibacter sp.]MBV8044617.1 hypothetical protein [Pluralibacter sp.]
MLPVAKREFYDSAFGIATDNTSNALTTRMIAHNSLKTDGFTGGIFVGRRSGRQIAENKKPRW